LAVAIEIVELEDTDLGFIGRLRLALARLPGIEDGLDFLNRQRSAEDFYLIDRMRAPGFIPSPPMSKSAFVAMVSVGGTLREALTNPVPFNAKTLSAGATMLRSISANRWYHWFETMGRLKTGMLIPEANFHLNSMLAALGLVLFWTTKMPHPSPLGNIFWMIGPLPPPQMNQKSTAKLPVPGSRAGLCGTRMCLFPPKKSELPTIPGGKEVGNQVVGPGSLPVVPIDPGCAVPLKPPTISAAVPPDVSFSSHHATIPDGGGAQDCACAMAALIASVIDPKTRTKRDDFLMVVTPFFVMIASRCSL